MAILILNRVSPEKAPYQDWLADIKEEIILITSSNAAYNNEKFTEVHVLSNYDENGYLEKLSLNLHKKYNFRAVIAISELDIIRAANIRENLGIDGQNLTSALAFRNKAKMKSYMSGGPIKVAQYKVIENPLDLIEFINVNGYPIILKPVDGSGSENTRVIKDESDFDKVLEKGIKDTMLAEEFINGDMYHIDGLVINGKVVMNVPSKYMNGCLAFQEGKYLGSYILEEANPMMPRLQQAVESLLGQMPTPNRTSFHAEIFHTPNDELYVCEIASRTGGGGINKTIFESFGVLLTQEWVQSQCMDEYSLNLKTQPSKYAGFVLIPPKVGKFISGPNLPSPKGVIEYILNAKSGQEYGEAESSVDHVAMIIIEGKTEEDVKVNVDLAVEWFSENSKWE